MIFLHFPFLLQSPVLHVALLWRVPNNQETMVCVRACACVCAQSNCRRQKMRLANLTSILAQMKLGMLPNSSLAKIHNDICSRLDASMPKPPGREYIAKCTFNCIFVLRVQNAYSNLTSFHLPVRGTNMHLKVQILPCTFVLAVRA